MKENEQTNTGLPIEVPVSEQTKRLASRWSRLGASLLDGLIIMVFTVPTMYFTGGFDGIHEGVQPSIGYNLAIGLLGFVVFLLINFKFLKNDGQTVGKKIVGIRIVDLAGNQAILGQHLLKRYAVYFLPGQIPLVGQFFSVVNILFIFGNQKRCIHDYAGGTKVVEC
ncbi:RDD family protein [Pelagicoccus enzymogenes]|uniref:RDD family protein n=1 Tax=Pelagicoccus enzymogenes TaxID=2773457 RepID=UPI00280FD8EB|nr:RDD family protein [Pelagicoccus enzymogenes]MDQ8201235.1 RDD family protein [Pelagicoccus enzymogenes]